MKILCATLALAGCNADLSGDTHAYWQAVSDCHQEVLNGEYGNLTPIEVRLRMFYSTDEEGKRIVSQDDLDLLMDQVRKSFAGSGISFIIEDAGDLGWASGNTLDLAECMYSEGLTSNMGDGVPVILGFRDTDPNFEFGATSRPPWRYGRMNPVIGMPFISARVSPYSLAHELGHYLGLFHLNEFGEKDYGDGLSDTPLHDDANVMRTGWSHPEDVFRLTPQQRGVVNCVARRFQ